MDFVQDNPGELVPEETFTHSHLSCFIHLIQSIASSLFNPHAWQSFSTVLAEPTDTKTRGRSANKPSPPQAVRPQRVRLCLPTCCVACSRQSERHQPVVSKLSLHNLDVL